MKKDARESNKKNRVSEEEKKQIIFAITSKVFHLNLPPTAVRFSTNYIIHIWLQRNKPVGESYNVKLTFYTRNWNRIKLENQTRAHTSVFVDGAYISELHMYTLCVCARARTRVLHASAVIGHVGFSSFSGRWLF